jgi:hypothetical protein
LIPSVFVKGQRTHVGEELIASFFKGLKIKTHSIYCFLLYIGAVTRRSYALWPDGRLPSPQVLYLVVMWG